MNSTSKTMQSVQNTSVPMQAQSVIEKTNIQFQASTPVLTQVLAPALTPELELANAAVIAAALATKEAFAKAFAQTQVVEVETVEVEKAFEVEEKETHCSLLTRQYAASSYPEDVPDCVSAGSLGPPLEKTAKTPEEEEEEEFVKSHRYVRQYGDHHFEHLRHQVVIPQIRKPAPPVTIEAKIPTLFEDPEYQFGIFTIKIADAPITKQRQLFVFMSDMSGSMESFCSDGKTKMQHSNHATKNIIRLAADCEEVEIWVQVNAFDDKITRVIEPQRITKDNLLQLLGQVDTILPRNATNLHLALNYSKTQIVDFLEYPEHQDFAVTHIFTTDGQATVGTNNEVTLAECVDPSYTNIFIGFGLDHSASTLAALSSRKNASYYFIDKIESGGLVFGEVMHSVLFRTLKDIRFEATDADIYNFKTNQWSPVLEIDYLTSDAERTYHLRTKNVFDVEIKITGTTEADQEMTTAMWVPFLENEAGEKQGEQDLTKYIFRQRTQELLFEVKQSSVPVVVESSYGQFRRHANQPQTQTSSDLQNRMRQFLAEMNAYMKDHSLEEDPIFQGLNDDMVITIRTFGTVYQQMYSGARATSNGQQGSYNVSEVPAAVTHRQNAHMPRQNAQMNFGSQTQDDDEAAGPLRMCSATPLSKNTTPRQLALMRSCSVGTQAEDILDKENSIPEEDEESCDA